MTITRPRIQLRYNENTKNCYAWCTGCELTVNRKWKDTILAHVKLNGYHVTQVTKSQLLTYPNHNEIIFTH
jgi:hypothetical protein